MFHHTQSNVFHQIASSFISLYMTVSNKFDRLNMMSNVSIDESIKYWKAVGWL